MKRIKITSETAHFGEILNRGDRSSYIAPPPSTIIGMLRVLYGDDIDNFRFGYCFQSEDSVKDSITIYKHGNASIENKLTKMERVPDCCYKELLTYNTLYIYTDIEAELIFKYPLSMGRSGNPARVHPIEKIELNDVEGIGINQYTDKSIGSGSIGMYNLVSNFNSKFDLYKHQRKLLRFNKEVSLQSGYDSELDWNIVLFQMKDGKVSLVD